ncbi:hypothetical protein J5N97_008112 [Dioscorea zingiberensis]|uniref:Snakin-2 n=1 Tax=Dioscorea zingiberensis TaxID=325984 RepID=A0A9D5DD45_9LILI|nr:hypothetical protein J5N97_008112 [Dioscorea zingiberensis]
MAFSRVFLTCLLLALLVLHLVDSSHESFEDQQASQRAGRSLLATIDCGAACSGRCRLSSRPNLCMRACGTCCARCNCVPPGTSGNTDQCPCYANMTTHGGRKKCP